MGRKSGGSGRWAAAAGSLWCVASVRGTDVRADGQVDARIARRATGSKHNGKEYGVTDGRYCPNSQYTGIHVDGAFAEYEILDARHLVPIPDDLSFEQVGPLLPGEKRCLIPGGAADLRGSDDLYRNKESELEAGTGEVIVYCLS